MRDLNGLYYRRNQMYCYTHCQNIWYKQHKSFESYAKGQATSRSDLDFIIDKGELIGIQYFSLLNELENAFNCKIDLITTGFSNKEFLDKIHKDEVVLYERQR